MRMKSPMALLAILLSLALLAAACGSDGETASDTTTADATTADTTEATEEAAADEQPAAEESEPESEPADEAMESESADDTSSSESELAAEAEEVAQPSMLRIGLQFSPDSGLAIETDDASVLMKAGVTEGLVRSDSSGQPVPALAESWERIDDTTWEFVLRPDVVFHDGSAFNAAAVETAIGYIVGVASPPRSLSGLTLSTEIIDDLTVRIVSSEPDPILPLRL